MAKRPQPKLKAQTPTATTANGPIRQSGPPSVEARPVSAAHPPVRQTYIEAVAIYEKGIEALQRHDFNHALELLQSVLRQYPEEKELHERVRLYLNICERHATPREA